MTDGNLSFKNDSEKYVLKDNFCFIRSLIMYRHFLDLISLDLRCLHFFVSADIKSVYTSKEPPSRDHRVIVKLTINICTLS